MKKAGFSPPMLIADAVMQVSTSIATLLIFSTGTLADGALLLSVWPDFILLGHRCLIKDWRYSLAALQVRYFCFRTDCIACCVYVLMAGKVAGACVGSKDARF